MMIDTAQERVLNARRRRWEADTVALDLCASCGRKPRRWPGSRLCEDCGAKQAARMKSRYRPSRKRATKKLLKSAKDALEFAEVLAAEASVSGDPRVSLAIRNFRRAVAQVA